MEVKKITILTCQDCGLQKSKYRTRGIGRCSRCFWTKFDQKDVIGIRDYCRGCSGMRIILEADINEWMKHRVCLKCDPLKGVATMGRENRVVRIGEAVPVYNGSEGNKASEVASEDNEKKDKNNP